MIRLSQSVYVTQTVRSCINIGIVYTQKHVWLHWPMGWNFVVWTKKKILPHTVNVSPHLKATFSSLRRNRAEKSLIWHLMSLPSRLLKEHQISLKQQKSVLCSWTFFFFFFFHHSREKNIELFQNFMLMRVWFWILLAHDGVQVPVERESFYV